MAYRLNTWEYDLINYRQGYENNNYKSLAFNRKCIQQGLGREFMLLALTYNYFYAQLGKRFVSFLFIHNVSFFYLGMETICIIYSPSKFLSFRNILIAQIEEKYTLRAKI